MDQPIIINKIHDLNNSRNLYAENNFDLDLNLSLGLLFCDRYEYSG